MTRREVAAALLRQASQALRERPLPDTTDLLVSHLERLGASDLAAEAHRVGRRGHRHKRRVMAAWDELADRLRDVA